MVSTLSTMLDLGVVAPSFSLPNTNPNVGGSEVSLTDYGDASAVLVAFICNHCPYVVHIREEFVRFANEYREKGLAVIAISANDAETYPADGPEAMAEEADRYHFPFPYLFDQTQEVAKSYRAACTPDFFLFDDQQVLVYRGQFDGARPRNEVPVTGEDLRQAVDAVLAGTPISGEQRPSMGCNIKWRQDNAPEYFPS